MNVQSVPPARSLPMAPFTLLCIILKYHIKNILDFFNALQNNLNNYSLSFLNSWLRYYINLCTLTTHFFYRKYMHMFSTYFFDMEPHSSHYVSFHVMLIQTVLIININNFDNIDYSIIYITLQKYIGELAFFN